MTDPRTPVVRFVTASDRSMLAVFGEEISLRAHRQVVKLLRLLQSDPIPEVLNLQPAYASLLIQFDALKLGHAALESVLAGYVQRLIEIPLPTPQRVEIPVCYGGAFGPDLDGVARCHGMTPADVIELHSSADYVVYFLGFAPGFAYLGGLPDALATPRLETPRRSVPAGSVGIAGKQTGVYPFSTPGGWNLIGRTPMAMFDASRDEMSLLSIGDCVRFVPVSSERFGEWITHER